MKYLMLYFYVVKIKKTYKFTLFCYVFKIFQSTNLYFNFKYLLAASNKKKLKLQPLRCGNQWCPLISIDPDAHFRSVIFRKTFIIFEKIVIFTWKYSYVLIWYVFYQVRKFQKDAFGRFKVYPPRNFADRQTDRQTDRQHCWKLDFIVMRRSNDLENPK